MRPTRPGGMIPDMAIAPETVSLEEFLELPEDKPALEYIDGTVRQKMSPKGQHSALQSEFSERINRHARPAEVARAFTELRTTFAGSSRVPDVAVYRWDRIPRTPDGRVANDFLVPPDSAIEIVSPGQSMSSLVRRSLWYVGNGVQLALAVDPDDESIFACHPGGTITAWHGADRIDLGELLPDFALTAAELFSSLR